MKRYMIIVIMLTVALQTYSMSEELRAKLLKKRQEMQQETASSSSQALAPVPIAQTPTPTIFSPGTAEALHLVEEFRKTHGEEEESAHILKPGIKDRKITISGIKHPIEFKQLAVNYPQESENVSCGPRSLFIAQALNQLITNKMLITPDALTKALPARYAERITQCTAQTTGEDFETYMKENDITLPPLPITSKISAPVNSWYVLGSEKSNRDVVVPVVTNYKNILDAQTLSELLSKDISPHLGGYGIKAVHFICSDPKAGHWILISVVKMNGEPPVMWYIDPTNMDADTYVDKETGYPYMHKFIKYIEQNLVIPTLE